METPSPSPGRPELAPRNRLNRARASNAVAYLAGVDQRSAAARRFRDIVAAIAVDQGGADRLSEARIQLVRRFAASAVLAERLEAKLANGEQINVGEHSLLCSTLCRLAQRIGINRRARDITPSLEAYLEQYDVDDEDEEGSSPELEPELEP